MKRRIIFLALIVPLLTFLCPGCSFGEEFLGIGIEEDILPAPAPETASFDKRADRGFVAMRGGGPELEAEKPIPKGAEILPAERKIIYTGDVSIEVKSCNESIEKIKAVVAEANGVVADTSVTEHDEGQKSAEVVIRVPADKFGQVMERLKDLGKVESQSSHGEDISEEYVDMEARLGNAKRMEARLIELLETGSTKLKDVLDVEKELGRVREKIERLEGKKRYFDQQVAMSTITISLFEPYKYTTSILDPVKRALDKAGQLFMRSIGAVLLFIAAAIPWFIVIGVIIYIIAFFVRRWIRKSRTSSKGKKSEDEEEMPPPPKKNVDQGEGW